MNFIDVMKNLNIDWLKKNSQSIFFFGLGFVQLKINKEFRLHFYNKSLPSFVEDPHDHRYDFKSWVLYGNFTQSIYEVDLHKKTHIIEQESCKEGIEIERSGIPCGTEVSSIHDYQKNSQYFISHNVFHTVTATDCVTFIRRSEYKKDLANVIREVGEEKVCPFSKKYEENMLWEIVESMLLKI